ncbi:retina-specific copper amine oxidase [Tupaia chinensis]|uniref:Amine oxidase n=1 Tax=Tupaia chinensis TaxID=246437 RepID=L9JWD6_TUPCH|nr:retina-specific copper amine oxidase [Tupaia chinensis]ELW54718.1 Retina-specific copper amine oxidase [Tupaia chinensis]
MNLKVVLVLLALSLITIFVLAYVLLTSQGGSSRPSRCPSVSQSASPWTHHSQSQLFADLSPEELTTVMGFLTQRLGPGLVDAAQARPSDNCVFSVELQLPPKAAALAHLDKGSPPPAREALAIVFFGGQPQPNVSELVVGPLPHPSYMRDVTVEHHGGPVPYHRRPVLRAEFAQMWRHLKEVELPKAPVFLASVFNYNYNSSTLASLPATPSGLRSGDRATWMALYHNISGVGVFLHPVGLELLLDHRALDPAHWAVQQVFYLGHYYADLVQLEWEFKAGRLEVVRVPLPSPHGTSSLRSRVSPGPLPPLQFSPQGPQYSVQGNLVVSSLWTLAFGHGVFSGMRIFDIRFKGERVAYEVSIQECLTVYGADSPKTMMIRYLDSTYGLGGNSRGLVRGVDCPYQATMVDIHVLVNRGAVQLFPGAVCIFEEAKGIPLRRHHNHVESHFYGGLASSALVIRSVSSVGNYDYIWDFVLHPNGALEGRVHASGYISTAFLSGGESLLFGNRVGNQLLGAVHTHAFHFKLDLDVAGLENWVVAEDVVFKPVAAPWSPENQLHRPQLTRQVLGSEDLAAFILGSPLPRYLYMASNQTNAWGHQRGYRIQIHSPHGIHVPLESSIEKALSWGRYQLAVTQRKEEESHSSSIYYQNDIWTSPMAFADFINNETLLGEDLVAWVTASFLHIPHAEDVPNTVTLGNRVGFLLQPYNFFDEDPSIFSPGSVYFERDQDAGLCSVNPVACIPHLADCVLDLPPFSYRGF